jgi:hypothetical protein
MIKRYISLLILSTALVWVACNNENNSNNSEETEKQITDSQDFEKNKATLLTVDGQIFSIPSPIQTALLIKDVETNYRKSILNSPQNQTLYNTKFKKAINLGIYGADLGYVTMYDQTQDAIKYLQVIRKLANELDISAAFDVSLVDRFENNLGNQDSILAMVSDAYRASDNYLKNSERNDIGALVLTGGFIESLFFSSKLASISKDKRLIDRVGEQKNGLENLIKLLSPYYIAENVEIVKLVDDLINLENLYHDVEYEYEYKEPETDINTKTTTITSFTSVKIDEKKLEEIFNKVKSIRESLIL